ncbi:membrane protein insertase YidC [Desulfogranum japonicum]|uniref:membrane protein insertase YidC n=1 Tax=Desulfogranum japonicum TaxID=231447 RepID=UPI000411F401|nr:membrane protein insertase YidC [Desulfogranum japonicum]
MDLHRAILAVAISFLILFGYQYFFVKPALEEQSKAVQEQVVEAGQSADAQVSAASTSTDTTLPTVAVDSEARDITIDTPLYTAVVDEQGGGFKSFALKQYRTDIDPQSGPMQLIVTDNPAYSAGVFTLDNGNGVIPTFRANMEKLTLKTPGESKTLVMKATMPGNIRLVRTLVFHADTYLINDSYVVENAGDAVQQISPAISMVNRPFSHSNVNSRYQFSGPTAFHNGELIQTKIKKLQDGPLTLPGGITWTGYVDHYFMTTIIPRQGDLSSVSLLKNDDRVRTLLSHGLSTLNGQEKKEFGYDLYLGPKKLDVLKQAGDQLDAAVNFGWFDMLAKPMLWLLNFFHDYLKNYGVAIILVTVIIKAVFWPITQRGMKSMKNMQKLQPKMAKLREKYKDDPAKMNQEMMAMYKTYKVNPLGGCLPMFIQIPFFFALYRVLMASIELRHAPFMLWINDLSAPDRLWIGVDIPYLHGIPVLTLLMGASMYLQQKMTPTTADPTQAKIMQFLPVIFTVMFLNFASGLVLYWFVNNLLSILQQQLINRENKA